MVPLMAVGSCHKSASQVAIQDKSCAIGSLRYLDMAERYIFDRGLTTPFPCWVCLPDLGGCLSVGTRAQSKAWFSLHRLVDYAADLLHVSHDTSQQRSHERRQSLARPFGILSVGSSTKER